MAEWRKVKAYRDGGVWWSLLNENEDTVIASSGFEEWIDVILVGHESALKAEEYRKALEVLKPYFGDFTPDMPDTGPDYIDHSFSEEESAILRAALKALEAP